MGAEKYRNTATEDPKDAFRRQREKDFADFQRKKEEDLRKFKEQRERDRSEWQKHQEKGQREKSAGERSGSGGHESGSREGAREQAPGAGKQERVPAAPESEEAADIERVMATLRISRAEYDLIMGRIQAMPEAQFNNLIQRIFGAQDENGVTRAYRALSMQYHPDLNKKTITGERFKALSALYREFQRRIGKK